MASTPDVPALLKDGLEQTPNQAVLVKLPLSLQQLLRTKRHRLKPCCLTAGYCGDCFEMLGAQ